MSRSRMVLAFLAIYVILGVDLLRDPRRGRIDPAADDDGRALPGGRPPFTAYVWLLRVTTASRVGTHAYVNPIVAVALGAALGGERVTILTVASALTIVAGVILVLVDQSRTASPLRSVRLQPDRDFARHLQPGPSRSA